MSAAAATAPLAGWACAECDVHQEITAVLGGPAARSTFVAELRPFDRAALDVAHVPRQRLAPAPMEAA